jgi:hypothetical protein
MAAKSRHKKIGNAQLFEAVSSLFHKMGRSDASNSEMDSGGFGCPVCGRRRCR